MGDSGCYGGQWLLLGKIVVKRDSGCNGGQWLLLGE